MGFPVAAMLVLAVALISSASRADGVDAEADCLLKCSGQSNICLASQVSTQAACMVQNEACQRACKEKKDSEVLLCSR